MRVGGSKAVWNFSENSSVLVASPVPKVLVYIHNNPTILLIVYKVSPDRENEHYLPISTTRSKHMWVGYYWPGNGVSPSCGKLELDQN